MAEENLGDLPPTGGVEEREVLQGTLQHPFQEKASNATETNPNPPGESAAEPESAAAEPAAEPEPAAAEPEEPAAEPEPVADTEGPAADPEESAPEPEPAAEEPEYSCSLDDLSEVAEPTAATEPTAPAEMELTQDAAPSESSRPPPVDTLMTLSEEAGEFVNVDSPLAADELSPEEVEAGRRRRQRRGRRMSQVERDMDDIFAKCDSLGKKGDRARRKSIELREDAAECVKRLDALLKIGATTKVVHAATKFKKIAKSKEQVEQINLYGGFTGKYQGHKTCFVCDEMVTDDDIKNGQCPLCATVLNHTTIKCRVEPTPTKPSSGLVGFSDIIN